MNRTQRQALLEILEMLNMQVAVGMPMPRLCLFCDPDGQTHAETCPLSRIQRWAKEDTGT